MIARKIGRSAAAVAATAMVGTMGLLATAPAANASLHFAANGVAIRSAPYTSGTVIYGRGYSGQPARADAAAPNGGAYQGLSGTSTWWWHVTNLSTGVTGWSGAGFMTI